MAWGARFAGRAKFQAFAHQEWVEWVPPGLRCAGLVCGLANVVERRYRM